MKKYGFIFVSFLLVSVTISPVLLYGAEIEGRYYSDTVTAGNRKLKLTGVGLMRYWGFKAYTGAFYLEEGVETSKALMEGAKRLELEYMRPIKGEDFGKATDDMVAKNVDATAYERLRPKIDYHNSLYEDVRPGDRYSLTYVPGRGTELALNGVPKGIIEGADFAAAIFSIWLGAEPISNTFKNQILGL